MSEEFATFTVFYFLVCFCIVYPPTEFITAGLTISTIFKGLLGSEEESFLKHHLRRTCLTLFIYSSLPLGYILCLYLFSFDDIVRELFFSDSILWKLFFTVTIIFPITALYVIEDWISDNFERHPIALNLSKFCNNNTSWRSVASDIDIEFRRVDKVIITSNAVTKVVATENWIIKVSPLTMLVTHQSDASFVVKNADTHLISIENSETQYLNIEIKSNRQGVDPFIIRINAAHFKDLEDRLARNITILPNVKFHKGVIDRFVDAFKNVVKNNPKYDYDQDLDHCIGCLQTSPNIKIQKLCEDVEHSNQNCTICYCRPMWCVECMAKWFASRQNAEHRETWLTSKCSCPMCRATFCLLDVCYLTSADLDND